jgi:hypothetical protein
MGKKNKRLNIKQMQNIARSRNGKCLSKKYLNEKLKLKWKCNSKHIWIATPNKIKAGSWCPICAAKKRGYNKRLGIKVINKIVLENDGECLSNNYIDNKTKLKFKCKNNHIWKTTPSNIKAGKWCPYCSKCAKLTIKQMKQLAKNKKGKCLSKKYKNNSTNLLWKCNKNHIWIAIPNNIKRGTWCLSCNENKKEKICRKIFENIYKVSFKKIRPKWLIYKKRPLELDGYNEELKIAFEYNGEQHYIPTHLFHNKINLREIQKRDKFKKQKCKEIGILLIIIPYYIKENNLESYIIEQLSLKQQLKGGNFK